MDLSVFLAVHQADNQNTTIQLILDPKIKLNSFLAEFLTEFKINSFSNGFLRTINDSSLNEIKSIWKWYDEYTVIFMRTAFGGLFYKRKSNFFYFDPLYGDIINLANDLNFILNVFLCDEQALSATFLFPLYKEVINRTGIPNENECLGFIPALKIGGQKISKNLEIMKLKEHLCLLEQL